MKSIDNLLIVKLSSLGDVLMNIPVVEGIKRSQKNINIGWAVEDMAADILKNYKTIDRLYILDKTRLDKNYKNYKFKKVYQQFKSFIKEISSDNWTNSLDLQWLFRSSLIPFLAGIKNRYGCVRTGLHQIFVNNNYKFKDRNYPEHVIDKNFQIMKDMGFIEESIQPEIFYPLSKELKEWGKKQIENYDSSLNIGIAPFSRWKSKNWSLRKYKKLIDLLIKELDCTVFIFGGKENKFEAKSNFDFDNNRIVSFVGNTNLNQFATLAKNMDLFISGDSFPMHVASFLKLNQIAVFGPTSYKKTGPINNKAKILKKDYDCITCFSKKCPLNKNKYKCMNDITVSEMKNKIFQVL